MMTREQRLKEREVKRILHEEELKRLEEDSKKLDQNEARLSERHLKAEMQRRQQELEKLAEEEDWVFDCSVCGLHGENLVILIQWPLFGALTSDRTTVHIALHARNAMCGSTANATVSQSQKLIEKTSTSYARTASSALRK